MMKWIAAVLLLVPFVAAPPAQASTNLGTFTFDCANPADITITGSPGDTVTLDSVNCQAQSLGVSGYSPPIMGSDFTITSGIWYLNPTTITLPMSFPAWYVVAWRTTPTMGFRLAATPNGGGGGAAADPAPSVVDGPPPVRQGVPVPTGGCSAVADADLAWGTGLAGGWQLGWERWEGYEGWACIRVMENVGGEWRLADRSHY